MQYNAMRFAFACFVSDCVAARHRWEIEAQVVECVHGVVALCAIQQQNTDQTGARIIIMECTILLMKYVCFSISKS